MSVAEAYDALDRGVVTGAAGPISQLQSWNLHEVTEYVTEGLNLFTPSQYMAISWSAWNRLTPQDQEILGNLFGRELSMRAALYYEQLRLDVVPFLNEVGMVFTPLTRDEVALWEAATVDVLEEYIAHVEGLGLGGRAFWDELVATRDALR
jgi:TRAP-type C4-dicarboxylate transport system substrate-binding protein